MSNKETLKLITNSLYAFNAVDGEDHMVSRGEMKAAITVGYNNEFGPDMFNRMIDSGMSRSEVLAKMETIDDAHSRGDIIARAKRFMDDYGRSGGNVGGNIGDPDIESGGSGAANGSGQIAASDGDPFWNQFDTDESGFVTEAEFETWLSSTDNPSVAPEELQGLKDQAEALWTQLLDDIDKNGLAEPGQPEGSVSFDQYQSWLASLGMDGVGSEDVTVSDGGSAAEHNSQSQVNA
jgi:hypothetical protein